MKKDLKTEHKLILSCIKINPNTIELEQINSLIPLVEDWDYLIATIIGRGIGPLFYKKLPYLSNSFLIPSVVKAKLQQVYYKTFSRSTVLHEHFRNIATAFAAQGIPVIALKGIYLSEWLYKDIGLRQLSDIDLLIKEENGPLCISILTRLGYTQVYDGRSEFVLKNSEFVHYMPMTLNGVSIELHIKVHRKSEVYQIEPDELWKNAIANQIYNSTVFALNLNDLLIHLCVHLDKHFREGHVQFTCFSDITNLLNEYHDTIDWDSFIETCRLHNSESVVLRYIVLVNKYMNAPVPELIVQKYCLLLTKKDEELFIKYLKGYTNFGSSAPVATHLANLKKLDSYSEKLRYIWEDLFPTRLFMLEKYGLQPAVGSQHSAVGIKQNFKQKFWWLWYPYRWWIGVKGVFKVISGK